MRRIDDVLAEVDVINLLRIQHERQRRAYFPGLGEYVTLFGLTKERAARLRPDCLIMHPGTNQPRGGNRQRRGRRPPRHSVILDQVTNGLAVRMAALYLCAGARDALPVARPQPPFFPSPAYKMS